MRKKGRIQRKREKRRERQKEYRERESIKRNRVLKDKQILIKRRKKSDKAFDKNKKEKKN